jgi:RNA 3'-terminal phosphate cyclase (ATP)
VTSPARPPVQIDGRQGEAGGQVLRTALAMAASTGQAFEMTRIRARRARPGLLPPHLAAVRAVAMACRAEVHGAFEGSPDLRFRPGKVTPGDFEFEIGTAGAATLVVQTLLPVLAGASEVSRVAVTGGTHVPRSPSFHFLARHWAPMVEKLGLRPRLVLQRAGFVPRGEGRLRAEVSPRTRARALDLTRRGALLGVCGLSASARLKGEVARRQAEAARALLWEERRIESQWDVLELPAASPGSCLQIEGVFEEGRAAFAFLGERGVRAEVLGERAARRLLRFMDMDQDVACVDPWLADQLAVPMALAGGGGRAATSEVTSHLETVISVLRQFGFGAHFWGRRGGPGGLEVLPC